MRLRIEIQEFIRKLLPRYYDKPTINYSIEGTSFIERIIPISLGNSTIVSYTLTIILI